MSYSTITKPSLPYLKWDDSTSFWDEADLFWDLSGYGDVDRPTVGSYSTITRTSFKNYLLTQSDDFLVFQDGSYINIGGENYDEIIKPT